MSELIDVDALFRRPTDAGDSGATESSYRLHRRFDRLGRLYGDGAVERLMRARVVVFGLGGVGSFAAEALARSAIGQLTLVDFDDVCVTNSNRQLQALKGNIGKPKADVLAERLRLVNPQAEIMPLRTFYNAERSDELLSKGFDFVVDCIDNMTAKAHLIATCRARGLPLISSMGAAGKRDPTAVRIADLSECTICPMAKDLRKILRKKHAFPAGSFGVTAVYSTEPRIWPRELTYDRGEGFRCVCPRTSDEHSCDSRAVVDGTAAFVTGTFGLVAASHVVNRLVDEVFKQSRPSPDRYGWRPEE